MSQRLSTSFVQETTTPPDDSDQRHEQAPTLSDEAAQVVPCFRGRLADRIVSHAIDGNE